MRIKNDLVYIFKEKWLVAGWMAISDSGVRGKEGGRKVRKICI